MRMYSTSKQQYTLRYRGIQVNTNIRHSIFILSSVIQYTLGLIQFFFPPEKSIYFCFDLFWFLFIFTSSCIFIDSFSNQPMLIYEAYFLSCKSWIIYEVRSPANNKYFIYFNAKVPIKYNSKFSFFFKINVMCLVFGRFSL